MGDISKAMDILIDERNAWKAHALAAEKERDKWKAKHHEQVKVAAEMIVEAGTVAAKLAAVREMLAEKAEDCLTQRLVNRFSRSAILATLDGDVDCVRVVVPPKKRLLEAAAHIGVLSTLDAANVVSLLDWFAQHEGETVYLVRRGDE